VYQHNVRHKDYVERAIAMIEDAYLSITHNDKWITASISDSKKVTIKVWQDDSLELPDNEL
jgi:hypothetical protein